MYQYEFLERKACADHQQFKEIINGMVQDEGWELFDTLATSLDIIACLRKPIPLKDEEIEEIIEASTKRLGIALGKFRRS